MRPFRWLLTVALIFAAGMALGPVLLAAADGLARPSDEQERRAQAWALLATFDAPDDHLSMPYIDFDAPIRDCGYTREALFGSPTPPIVEGRAWTPYSGYLDLFAWQGQQRRRAVEAARANILYQDLRAFQLAFLDDCMRSTAFSGLCAGYVRQVLESGGGLSSNAMPSGAPRFDQRREERTICTYLDGLAARRGLRLAGGSVH